MSIDVLAGLLDEKLIRILSLFLKFPEKKFSLTEVCRLSRVNNATTFRTLNKLVSEELVKVIVIGKTRMYELATGERALALTRLLKIEDTIDPLKVFCERMKTFDKVLLVILDSRTSGEAKVILVSESPMKDKLVKLIDEIRTHYKFNINFVELRPVQYEGLKSTSMFGDNKKILYSSLT